MTSTEMVPIAKPELDTPGPRGLVVWSGVPAAAGTLDRLPGSAEHDPFDRLLGAFLLGYPRHSARAYYRDVSVPVDDEDAVDAAELHPATARMAPVMRSAVTVLVSIVPGSSR